MLLTLEQANALVRRLEPYPPDRVSPLDLLQRKRAGGAVPKVQSTLAPIGGGAPSSPLPPIVYPERPTVMQSKVVPLLVQTGAQSMTQVVSGQLQGPAMIDYVRFQDFMNTSSTGQQFNMRRVEFSPHSVLQNGTFSGTAIASGFVSDGITLFDQGEYIDTVQTTQADLQRWWMNNPSAAGPEHIYELFPHIYIPYPAFWIKFYYQNDTSGTVSCEAFFDVKLLQAIDIGESPEVPDAPLFFDSGPLLPPGGEGGGGVMLPPYPVPPPLPSPEPSPLPPPATAGPTRQSLKTVITNGVKTKVLTTYQYDRATGHWIERGPAESR